MRRRPAYRPISRIDWTRGDVARIVADKGFTIRSYDPTQRKRGSMRLVFRVLLCTLCVLAATMAGAQVVNGSITGSVTATSGGVLPGVNVTLTGARLIGGGESQVTDATGGYRFDHGNRHRFEQRHPAGRQRHADRRPVDRRQ